jgi:hypothetical protein
LNRPHVLAVIGFAVAAAAVGLALALRSEEQRRVDVAPPIAPGSLLQMETKPPRIDVVRVGEKGDMVIAGRATSKAEIVIEADSQLLGSVTADSRGEWVFVPNAPPEMGVRVLTLRLKGSAAEPERIIVVMPDADGQPTWIMAVDAADRVRLLGEGSGTALAIRLLNRDRTGLLSVIGRGEPGRIIQLYAGDRFLARTSVDGDGDWSIEAQPRPGAFELRADQVEANGKVMARLSLPAPAPDSGAATITLTRPDPFTWRVQRPGGAVSLLLIPDPGQQRDPRPLRPGQVWPPR